MEIAKNLPGKKRVSLATILTTAVFVAILAVGLLTYQDYGYTTDEYMQRMHSVVNYQYAIEAITGHQVQAIDKPLQTYAYRTYGVALQLPMVFTEHLTHFSMHIRDVFVMRHLFTFIICYIGYICFYLFAKKVFGSRWLALLGVLMLVIYPRFWGEQFTNIKDMVFMATCCASMLCVALCLEHEGKWRYEVFAGFVFAICANTRVVGLIVPGLLFGYRILRDLWIDSVAQKQGARKLLSNIGRYVAQLLMLGLFYVLVAPAAWANPLGYVKEVFTTFSNYDVWNGNILFLGNWFSANHLPGYYIPVWLGIAMPLWYLVLLVASVPQVVGELVTKRGEWLKALFSEYKYYLFCFVIGLFPVVWMCVKTVTLYNGWRHVYYIVPFLIVLMLYGARFVWRAVQNRLLLKRIAVGAVCVLLAVEGAFIVRNHPFEKVYFNPLGKTVADGVDRDFWCESFYAQYQYLLAHDSSNTIYVMRQEYSNYTYEWYLSVEDQSRIRMCEQGDPQVEYIIDRANGDLPEGIEAFVPLHQIEVDGIVISTLYVRKDLFEERYHGQIPE